MNAGPSKHAPTRVGWGLCLGLVAACALDQTATPRQPTRAPPEAPTIDGRREACMLPPFLPGESSTLADGTAVASSDAQRRWTVMLHPSAAAATRAELQDGADRLRAEPGLARLHRSRCDEPGDCWKLWLPLCTTTLDEVVATVRRAVDGDPVLAERSIPLQIELLGRLGPRCEADDPECTPVPEPHSGGGFYDPTGTRAVLPAEAVGTCEHDGDCLVSGCHQQTCLAWELGSESEYSCAIGVSPLGCSNAPNAPHCHNPCRSFDNGGGAMDPSMCDEQRRPSRVFCGCVDRRCVWFDQR
ncbi:MAG: hypothetical protein AAF721_12565 [Myxococcota bacterium]